LIPFIFGIFEKTKQIKAVCTPYIHHLIGSAPFSPILTAPNRSYFPSQAGFGKNKGYKPLLFGYLEELGC
jgi:hypothetical protein